MCGPVEDSILLRWQFFLNLPKNYAIPIKTVNRLFFLMETDKLNIKCIKKTHII